MPLFSPQQVSTCHPSRWSFGLFWLLACFLQASNILRCTLPGCTRDAELLPTCPGKNWCNPGFSLVGGKAQVLNIKRWQQKWEQGSIWILHLYMTLLLLPQELRHCLWPEEALYAILCIHLNNLAKVLIFFFKYLPEAKRNAQEKWHDLPCRKRVILHSKLSAPNCPPNNSSLS